MTNADLAHAVAPLQAAEIDMLQHLWRSLTEFRRTSRLQLPRVYQKNHGTANAPLNHPYIVDVPTVQGIKVQRYGTYAFTDDEGRVR